MPTGEELLRMLRQGGCITSSGDCSPQEIEQARLCGRLHIDLRGFGHVYRPPVRLLPQEAGPADTLPFLAAAAPMDWDHELGGYRQSE